MIAELIFLQAIPVPGVPNFARQERFRADEGWVITTSPDGVRLSRVANGAEWAAIEAFWVVDVPYAFVDKEVPVKAEKPKGISAFCDKCHKPWGDCECDRPKKGKRVAGA